ncbi:MAG: hypothetical protein ACE5JX_12010, partial [Acidobacteriota bacterium]
GLLAMHSHRLITPLTTPSHVRGSATAESLNRWNQLNQAARLKNKRHRQDNNQPTAGAWAPTGLAPVEARLGN